MNAVSRLAQGTLAVRFFLLGWAISYAVAAASGAPAAPSKKPAAASPPQIFEDVPQPMAARRPLTDAERDHLQALALFAVGRTHERREQYTDALRCYQRALRYDQQAAAVDWAIVRVAFHLKRYDEAARYALLPVELTDAEPLLFRRLAVRVSEENDWARAVALYEKALAAAGRHKETATDILLRMELGRIYHFTEKYPQAAANFARVLAALDHPGEFAIDEPFAKALLGDAAATYQTMGDCFLAAGRPQEARAAFEKAERLKPDKALWQFHLAGVLAKSGKPAEALAALEAAFAERLHDEGTAPYETLAEVLGALGKKNELAGRLEKLRADRPADAPLGYYLADQYRAAGNKDKAEALYVALLKERPSAAGYRGLMEIYRQGKRFDALLALLGGMLEKTSVLDTLGTESQTISGDAEVMRGLIAAGRAKLKADAAKFGYGDRLAVALLALEAKQYETANEFFQLALAAKPKAAGEVLMAWGVGLLMADRPAEAAKVFQRGIDEKLLPDDNPAFYFYLAGALALAERTDDALAAARTAATKKKDSARFRGRVAWVLYGAKRYAEAGKAYEELVRQFDADRDSAETRDVLREARLALSNLAVIRGDLPAAEEWLEQVLDEFPDDEGALNDLGYLWADQNKCLPRAKRMIEQAVKAEPDNTAYRDSLGWVLFRLGQLPEAVVQLEKAAADKKPDGTVLDHLGDAYARLNRRDKALEAWRKAADAFRREKDTEKLKTVEKKLLAK
jgi:tetratricopeptide (TPR) repeat protein